MALYYDTIIIGAGPAGIAAALSALSTGQTVFLVDKEEPSEQNITDTGFIANSGVTELSKIGCHTLLSPQEQVVDVTFQWGGSETLIRNSPESPGFMIDRNTFSEQMLQKVWANGGYYEQYELVDFTQKANNIEVVLIQVGDKNCVKKYFTCKKLIGADGSNSTVAELLRNKTRQENKTLSTLYVHPLLSGEHETYLTIYATTKIETSESNSIQYFHSHAPLTLVFDPNNTFSWGWSTRDTCGNIVLGYTMTKKISHNFSSNFLDNIKHVSSDMEKRLLLLHPDLTVKPEYETVSTFSPVVPYTFGQGNILLVGDAMGRHPKTVWSGIEHGLATGIVAGRLPDNDMLASQYATMLKKEAKSKNSGLINVSIAHTYLSKKNLLQYPLQITDEIFNIIMKTTPLGGVTLTKADIYHLTSQMKKPKKIHFFQKLTKMLESYKHHNKKDTYHIDKSAKELVKDKEK